MRLLQRQPLEPLRSLVANMVYHEGYAPPHAKEAFLPDGGVDLVVDLSENPKRLFDNERLLARAAFRHGWVSGVRLARIVIQASRGEPMIVVRVEPEAVPALFGFPASELTDRIVALDDLWGPDFSLLRERLLAASEPQARFELLGRFFLERAGAWGRVHPGLRAGVALLLRRKAPPGMKRFAETLGYSQKHVGALFDKHIGVSPKRFARIVRFQRIVETLERGRPRSWSDFALDFGFFDQSHFVNEFKAFAGMPPERYLAVKGDFLNYLPID